MRACTADFDLVYYAGYDPQPVTLRQWFALLECIYSENKCTPENQMELLMCMKEQGFEI